LFLLLRTGRFLLAVSARGPVCRRSLLRLTGGLWLFSSMFVPLGRGLLFVRLLGEESASGDQRTPYQ
jgi:hypothetical protein